MTRSTRSLNLLLQNGLEITAEGTCSRHPQVQLYSQETGDFAPCHICSSEQKQKEQKEEEHQAQSGSEGGDNESKVSLAKMIDHDNNRESNHIQQHNELDGEELDETGSLEMLIARWCQLQDTTARTSNHDMLSTTLILLQLQKLERRVQQQETNIRTWQESMQEQQTGIQRDLTRILDFVGGAASGTSQTSQPTTYPTTNVLRTANTNSIATTRRQDDIVVTPPTRHDIKVVNNHRRHHHQSQRSFLSQSQKSLLHREPHLHPASAFTSVRTIERQPPKPPKRHDSIQQMDQEILEAAAERGHNSVQSSTESSSAVERPVRSAVRNAALSPPPPPPPMLVSTTSGSTVSTAISNPSVTGIKKAAAVGTATNSSGRPNLAGHGPHPLKPKTSFRKPTTPQLEIIWDASEHTTNERRGSNTSGDPSPIMKASAANVGNSGSANVFVNGNAINTNNSNNRDFPGKPKSLLFKGKGAIPTLKTSLDDDETTFASGESSILLGMKTYLPQEQQQQQQQRQLRNKKQGGFNESIMTSDFHSFTGDDTTADSSINDVHHKNSPKNGNTTKDVNTTSDHVERSINTDDESCTTTNDEGIDGNATKVLTDKERKKIKKEKKREKKELKKEMKKAKKNEKKGHINTIAENDANNILVVGTGAKLINNKVSPASAVSEDTFTKRKRRFSTNKVFWKRPSRSRSHESSPSLPLRQISNDFSFVTDNPRTHSLPSDVEAQQAKETSSNASINGNDIIDDDLPALADIDVTNCGDDFTVKTPMTAKTPRSAIMAFHPTEAPPAPQPQVQRQKVMKQIQQQRLSTMTNNNNEVKDVFHPPSPPPRRRAPFPRTRGMMPTLVNSKREIIIGGDSSRMQLSTLTLDTALPSADAGSVLQEVTSRSLTDKCNERGTYTGTVNEMEEPDGYGTMIYSSGAFYKGDWKEGRWHGEGILRTVNGDSYEGDFVYDCRHGRGIYKYENGDVYEGDFSSDKRHGKGTFLFQNGSMYRGDFAYGNFHGYGWYEFDEGYYEGSWVEGNYEGIGTLTYKDGSHYTGRFKAGAADGLGEEWKADGTNRRGLWKNGEFQGQQHDESVLSV